jgi:hypothetical protein
MRSKDSEVQRRYKLGVLEQFRADSPGDVSGGKWLAGLEMGVKGKIARKSKNGVLVFWVPVASVANKGVE